MVSPYDRRCAKSLCWNRLCDVQFVGTPAALLLQPFAAVQLGSVLNGRAILRSF